MHRLIENGLTVTIQKCVFEETVVEFLRYMILKKGVSIVQVKAERIFIIEDSNNREGCMDLPRIYQLIPVIK